MVQLNTVRRIYMWDISQASVNTYKVSINCQLARMDVLKNLSINNNKFPKKSVIYIVYP